MSKRVYSLDDVLGSKTEEFELGGRRFRAQPLSLAEGLRIDAAGGKLEEQLKALAPIMAKRAVGGDEVSAEWLADHLTPVSGGILIEILRSGVIPERDTPNSR